MYPITSNTGVYSAITIPKTPIDIKRGPIERARFIPFFKLSVTDSITVGEFLKAVIPSFSAVWNLLPTTCSSGSPGWFK